MTIMRAAAIAAGLLVSHGVYAEPARLSADVVVSGSAMKGVHGLAFDKLGRLYGVSITGMSLYRIGLETGLVETIVGPPDGFGDDIAFGPDGSMAWTANNRVLLRTPAGEMIAVAEGLAGLNSIAFGPDGRLFFTTIFRGDALYEGDPTGATPPKIIAEKLMGLNGFEVTADGQSIIGPQFFGNAIVSIDLATGAITRIAEDIQTPAAVNLLSNGDIVALGYRTGIVYRIDPATGAKTEMVKLDDPPLDNLAIASNDLIYISHSSFNGVTELNPRTGQTRRIVWGDLSAPGGQTVMTDGEVEKVLIADAWGYRVFDPSTNAIAMVPAAPTVFGSVGISADADKIITTNVTPAGMVQIVDRASGTPTTSLFGFGAPYGALATPEGALIADFGADAIVLLGSGEKPPRETVATGLGGPVGLAPAGDNAVYVTGYIDGTVSRVSLADGTREVIALALEQPEGIAALPDGKLAVAEVGKKRLIVIDPASGDITAATDTLPLGYELAGAGPPPGLFTGVAVTSNGDIYVTGDADNSVIRVRQ